MTSRTRHAALVVLVAIAGLAVAVALALLTSHLTTQHVGLAGEPSRPATGLVAPVRRARTTPRPAPRPTRKRTKTVTVAPPAVTVTPPPVTVAPPAPTTPATRTIPTHRGEHERKDD